MHAPLSPSERAALASLIEPETSARVLVYSHDTFGLGNIRRMLEISKHLVENDPTLQVLILTGSPMLHAFRIPPRIDYVKLPCLARDVKGGYGAKFLDITQDECIRLRANLIKATALDFRPDLILVDKKPFGVQDELGGMIEALGALAKKPKLALLLRDILDAPEATTPVWKKNGYFAAIESWYDEVLVVGSPQVFDLRSEYAFPPFAAAKVNFCGYVARTEAGRSPAAIRAELGVGERDRLVLVTPGGGEDGAELLQSYLDALAQLPLAQRPHTLMICGPELAADRRAQIEQAARGFQRMTVRAFTDEIGALMRAADLVVCMGGYNTVCEVLTHRKRAILLPRVTPVQEQWIRAQRLAKRGLLRAIHPRDLTPALFARTMAEELDACALSPSPVAAPLDMSGLQNVARAVARLLGRLPVEEEADAPVFHAPRAARRPATLTGATPWAATLSVSW